MTTFDQILFRFGGAHRFAQLVNGTPGDLHPGGRKLTTAAVFVWRHRKRLPAEWFAAVLDASHANDIGVSAQDLIEHATRPAASIGDMSSAA